jgi:hypothetical protein
MRTVLMAFSISCPHNRILFEWLYLQETKNNNLYENRLLVKLDILVQNRYVFDLVKNLFLSSQDEMHAFGYNEDMKFYT